MRKRIPRIAPDGALDLILRCAKPLGSVRAPLADALGAVLAEDVRADRDLPPAPRSAMDGYAVRAADLRKVPCELRLAGEVAAGSDARPRVRPGTCVRILTGGNVPPGADAVVMVETTEERDGRVLFRRSPECGANTRLRGEDAKKDEVLLAAGSVLGARGVGMCAAVGRGSLRVGRRPRIALLTTGAELRPIEARVRAHEVRDSNGPMLRAALATWGFAAGTVRSAPDDFVIIAAKLRRLIARHDAVLLSGGVSVGRYDFVREAVERVGARVRFHGVAMKPGKPLLYATLPRNRHVFGLPGNPVSSAIGFHEFALPGLRRLAGAPPDECRPAMRVPLAEKFASRRGPLRFVLGRLVWGNGGPTVERVRSSGSSDLVAGGRADGVIAVPGDGRTLARGTLVEFRPWRPLP